jgi:NAD(P)-dependent dehydrogenase (short-subunit alcohol dehydrogenase family)
MNPYDYSAPPDLLAGRVILVTGASGGIGRAVALACARHGASVVLHGRDNARLEALYDEIESVGGPQPSIVVLDLAQAGDREFESLVQALRAQSRRLDGIVHAAAHFTHLGPLEHERLDDWLRLLRVNAAAAFALTRACTPLLREAPDASVVLTGETHGAAPAVYWGGFAVSKAALAAYCTIQAQEWDTLPGLRINLVVPGRVDSPQRRKTHPGEAPASRLKPEALTPLYLYLLGPDSRGVNGKVFERTV